jgi:Ca2+-binding EF-hand superfamily protein
MQRLRDRLLEKRATATEAFRAFDVDKDGFVSRDDFIAGCTGSSHTVFHCLNDTKELGCEKRISFEQSMYENDHFTKTGSGQTWEKLRSEVRFPQAERAHGVANV